MELLLGVVEVTWLQGKWGRRWEGRVLVKGSFDPGLILKGVGPMGIGLGGLDWTRVLVGLCLLLDLDYGLIITKRGPFGFMVSQGPFM